MSCIREARTLFGSQFVAALLLIAGFSITLWSEEKKEEKKPEPPTVLLVSPLGVVPGASNTIIIRGLNLTNVSEIRWLTPTAAPQFEIKSKGKAEVPKQVDAKKAGDTQLEVALTLTKETSAGTLSFVVVSPHGESKPHSLLVLDPASHVKEVEPNGSFRKPQPIEPGQVIQGSIQEPNDVDVFQVKGKAGQRIVARVAAAKFGSVLDSIVTLYDAKGHMLATNDDSDSERDSTLEALLPGHGVYYLSVVDAHERGGPSHPYQFEVQFR